MGQNAEGELNFILKVFETEHGRSIKESRTRKHGMIRARENLKTTTDGHAPRHPV